MTRARAARPRRVAKLKRYLAIIACTIFAMVGVTFVAATLANDWRHWPLLVSPLILAGVAYWLDLYVKARERKQQWLERAERSADDPSRPPAILNGTDE